MLVAPRVFLTAAHCLDLDWLYGGTGYYSLWVSFAADARVTEWPDPDALVDTAYGSAYWVSNPDLYEIEAYVFLDHPHVLAERWAFWDAVFNEGVEPPYYPDTAAIILRDPVDIEPAVLAPVGFLDRKYDKRDQSTVVAAGYGWDEMWANIFPYYGFTDRREVGTPVWDDLVGVNGIHTVPNTSEPGPLGVGIHYPRAGDSGSGLWWVDDDTGVDQLIGICTMAYGGPSCLAPPYGYWPCSSWSGYDEETGAWVAPDCPDETPDYVPPRECPDAGRGVYIRTDTQKVHDFVRDVIDHVDDPEGITTGPVFTPPALALE